MSVKNRAYGTCHITFYEIACGIYLLHKLLPAVGVKMPSSVYLLVFGCVFIASWTRISRDLQGSKISNIIPYFVFSIVTFFSYLFSLGVGDGIVYLYGELQLLLFGMIAIVFSHCEDTFGLDRLIKFVLFCYAITAVTTIIGCINNPNAARTLASIGALDEQYQEYALKNIGSFSFCYEITLLVPLIMMLLKDRKINRFIGVALIVLFGFAIFEAEYTTALVFYVISIIICVLSGRKGSRYAIITFIGVFLIIVLFRDQLSIFLQNLSGHIDSETISLRLSLLAEDLSSVGRDAEYFSQAYRLNLYSKSWEIFISTMGLGNWTGIGGGGHSFVLDNMARYGILGLLMTILFFRNCYKLNVAPYKNEYKYWNLLWTFLMLLIFAFINPKSNLYFVVFLFPLFTRKSEV